MHILENYYSTNEDEEQFVNLLKELKTFSTPFEIKTKKKKKRKYGIPVCGELEEDEEEEREGEYYDYSYDVCRTYRYPPDSHPSMINEKDSLTPQYMILNSNTDQKSV